MPNNRLHSLINIRLFLLPVWLFVCSFNAISQEKLLDEYNKYKSDTERSITEKENWICTRTSTNNEAEPLEIIELYYEFVKEMFNSDLDKALEYSKKIVALGTKAGLTQHDLLIRTQNNLVLISYYNNQYFQALTYANEYFEKYPEKNYRLAKIYRLVGGIYNELGDYPKAIDAYYNSAFILREIKDYKNLGKTNIGLIETFINYEDTTIFDKSKVLLNEMDDLIKNNNLYEEDYSPYFLNKGVLYEKMGKLLKAENAYQKTLQLATKQHDNYFISQCYINLSGVNKKQGNIEISQKMLDLALQHCDDDPVSLAMIYNNQGDLFLMQKQYEKAIENYQKSIEFSLAISDHRTPIKKDLELTPDKIYLFGYLNDLAEAWHAYSQEKSNPSYYQKALDTYILADQLLTLIYQESTENVSKLFWREKGAEMYFNAINIAYKLNNDDWAYYFQEKNSAYLLLEDIIKAKNNQLSKLPRSITKADFDKKSRIKDLQYDLIYLPENDPSKESLRNQIFNLKKEYMQFKDSIHNLYPELLKNTESVEIIDLLSFQSTLNENDIVFHFSITDSLGFISKITNKNFEIHKLKNVDALNQEIIQYKKRILKPFVTQADKNDFAKVSHLLFQQLFPDDLFDCTIENQNLTIITDNKLQNFPFESLLTSNNPEEIEAYFLINFCNIHYNYSLSINNQTDSIYDENKKLFLSISPTIFPNTNLSELKISKEETETLQKLFAGDFITNSDATIDAFYNNFGKYRIVHLSTHGGYENGIPWLAFYDGKIRLNNLSILQNQSNLVVLSACKTNEGKLKKGEGVLSIARAFINSGSKSVISSIWDINEESSYQITKNFYSYLKEGFSKSASLRKAKIDYLKANKNTSQMSPYFWSSLILYGNDDRLFEKSTPLYQTYIFIGIIVLLGFVFFVLKRNSK